MPQPHESHPHRHTRVPELPPEPVMLGLVQIFQALSDLTRAKVVFALSSGERSVNEIALLVDASPSAVSHHLRRLRDAGLVTYHRHGNQVFYSIQDAHVAALLEEAQNHIDHAPVGAARRVRRK